MKYIFYKKNINKINSQIELEENYSFCIWRPGINKIFIKGLDVSLFTMLICWIMHHLRLFRGRDYSIFVVLYNNSEIAHYSMVLPKSFRFPFMKKDDLQIGPSWTNPKHRRKGLLSFAIAKMHETFKDKDRNFWYITKEENIPSNAAIIKIGFVKFGEGVRKDMGLGLVGVYNIDKIYIRPKGMVNRGVAMFLSLM